MAEHSVPNNTSNPTELTPDQTERMVNVLRDIYEALSDKSEQEDPPLSLYEIAWLKGLDEFFKELEEQ